MNWLKDFFKKFLPETMERANIKENTLEELIKECRRDFTAIGSEIKRKVATGNQSTNWEAIYNLGRKYRSADTEREKEIILSLMGSKKAGFLERGIEDRETDITFLSFPYWDVVTPFSAVPTLCGYLKRKGYKTKQIDLGILTFYYRFNKHFNVWSEIVTSFLTEEYYLEKVADNKINTCISYEDYVARYSFLKEKNISIQEIKKIIADDKLGGALFYCAVDSFNQSSKQNLDVFSVKKYHSLDEIITMAEDELLLGTVNYFGAWKSILKTKIIGISITSSGQIPAALFFSKFIRYFAPDIIMVLGGSAVDHLLTIINEKALFEWFDYVVLHEGETALTKLIEYIQKRGASLEDIPNIMYCVQGVVHRTHGMLEDVTELPPPDYDGIDLSLYLSIRPILAYQSSRGCFYGQCAFCNHEETYRRNYRKKLPGRVVQDIIDLSKKYAVRDIQFVDEAIEPVYFKELVSAMDNTSDFKELRWFYYSRVSPKYDEAVLHAARKNGCTMVMFGIESFNQRLLNFIKKGIRKEHSVVNLKQFYEAGIKIHGWFLWGLPSETPDEVVRDMEEFQEYSGFMHTAWLGRFGLFPNCEMYKEQSKYCITAHDSDDIYDFKHVDVSGEQVDVPSVIRRGLEYQKVVENAYFYGNRYLAYFY